MWNQKCDRNNHDEIPQKVPINVSLGYFDETRLFDIICGARDAEICEELLNNTEEKHTFKSDFVRNDIVLVLGGVSVTGQKSIKVGAGKARECVDEGYCYRKIAVTVKERNSQSLVFTISFITIMHLHIEGLQHKITILVDIFGITKPSFLRPQPMKLLVFVLDDFK